MEKQNSGDELSLKEIIMSSRKWGAYFFSYWKFFLLVGFIGGIAGFTYAYMQKPVYNATLTFILEDKESKGGAFSLASQFGFDIGGSEAGIFTGANLIELFKSRAMIEKTLLSPVTVDGKVISFAEMYIQILNWRKKTEDNKLTDIYFLPDADEQKFNRAQDSLMSLLYENLIVNSLKVEQKDKKIDILSISMQSENEIFAKYFTEALAKQVSDFYVVTKSKKARINMDLLDKQTDSVRTQLNSAISGVASASDDAFNLNPALNVRRVPSTRHQVDVQINSAILSELVKQREMAKVVLRKETPLIQVIDKPVLPLKKEKLGKAKGMVYGSLIAGLMLMMILTIKMILSMYNDELR